MEKVITIPEELDKVIQAISKRYNQSYEQVITDGVELLKEELKAHENREKAKKEWEQLKNN